MKYIVLEGRSPAQLEVEVNKKLEEGYELVGGASCSSYIARYIQAMIKK